PGPSRSSGSSSVGRWLTSASASSPPPAASASPPGWSWQGTRTAWLATPPFLWTSTPTEPPSAPPSR
ncbi:MAG: hypothetical protein C4305_09865, partial [Thermoleophilia bacterium]